eukprot:XP_011660750.1 PREDICTED: uncharacterized protein LOC105436660 [Strongylocentrotus purpuratus]
MKLLSDDVISYFGRGIMLGIPNKGDLDDDADTIKSKMSKIIGIPANHVWIFKSYTLKGHKEDVERSIEFLDFILYCLTVAMENQQFRDSQKEKEQIPSTQTENQQIQNIQTENQQIPSTQTENQQIPSTHTEYQQIQNIQTENQQIQNTQTENQQIPNIQKEIQRNPNSQTEAWPCNII